MPLEAMQENNGVPFAVC